MTPSGESDTDAILSRALVELEERHAKLEPFVDELRAVEKKIRALRSLLNMDSPRKRAPAGGPSLASRILEFLERAKDPLSAPQIAAALENRADYTSQVLNRLLEQEKVVKSAGRWSLPEQ